MPQSDEKQVMFVVGHKDGSVVLQAIGEEPHHFTWDPQRARQIAALLLEAADAAEVIQ